MKRLQRCKDTSVLFSEADHRHTQCRPSFDIHGQPAWNVRSWHERRLLAIEGPAAADERERTKSRN